VGKGISVQNYVQAGEAGGGWRECLRRPSQLAWRNCLANLAQISVMSVKTSGGIRKAIIGLFGVMAVAFASYSIL